MSEENGQITHSCATLHQHNLTATENKTMGITSPEVLLCTLVGNWYNLILVLCTVTLDPGPVLPCFEAACPASFATSD